MKFIIQFIKRHLIEKEVPDPKPGDLNLYAITSSGKEQIVNIPFSERESYDKAYFYNRLEDLPEEVLKEVMNEGNK